MTLEEAYQIINDIDEGTRTDRYYRQLGKSSPIPHHTDEEVKEAWELVNEDQERRIKAAEDAEKDR